MNDTVAFLVLVGIPILALVALMLIPVVTDAIRELR